MFYRCLYDDQIFLKDLWFEFCKMGKTFRLQTDSYDPCHGNLSGDHRLNSCNFSLRSSHCSRPFFFVLKTTVSEYRGRKQSETTMPCLAMGLVKCWYDGRGSTAQWTSEQKAFSIASSFQIFHWSFAWFELVRNHVEPQRKTTDKVQWFAPRHFSWDPESPWTKLAQICRCQCCLGQRLAKRSAVQGLDY